MSFKNALLDQIKNTNPWFLKTPAGRDMVRESEEQARAERQVDIDRLDAIAGKLQALEQRFARRWACPA